MAKAKAAAAATTDAQNAQTTTPAADAAQTDATPTTPAPAPAKEKTPEQKAAALRREAGELRRSAKALGETTDAGKSLVALADGKDADADALAPRKSAKSSEPRPTCKGTKKDGSPCTARAMEGSEYCTDHRPVRSRFSDEEWAAFQAIDTATIVELLGWGRALKLAKEAVAASKE